MPDKDELKKQCIIMELKKITIALLVRYFYIDVALTEHINIDRMASILYDEIKARLDINIKDTERGSMKNKN